MIAYYKIRGNRYVCSNCRLQYQKISPRCPFCDSVMANYEELLIDNYKILEKATIDNLSKLEYNKREEKEKE